MTFALLAPVALAALAALAVPLLIHLARRTEEQPTDFAALRWLRRNPRPRKRPRLDERVLLAVRLVLVALLALWLAQPVLTGAAGRSGWVAVLPGVDPARAIALLKAGARGVWLAPGFPPLDTPAPADATPTASLIRELDATLPPRVPLTVLVPPVIADADAQRPQVARPLAWRIVPGRVPAATPAPPRVPVFALRVAPGVEGVDYLRAAAAALGPANRAIDLAPISAPLPQKGVVAWWATGVVPATLQAWAMRGGTVLLPPGAILPPGTASVVWRDAAGAPLAVAVYTGRGRIVRFARSLNPAAMPILLDPGFPDALARLVFQPLPPPTRVRAQDYAPEPGAAQSSGELAERWPLQPWIAVVIALLFLAERLLATRRRRAIRL